MPSAASGAWRFGPCNASPTLDRFKSHVHQRWNAGVTEASVLHTEPNTTFYGAGTTPLAPVIIKQ